MTKYRGLLAAGAAAVALLGTAPASAAVVTLRVQGTLPGAGVQGAGIGPFTTFQNTFFGTYVNFGNSYDFTFSYDTAAAQSGGVYPLTLVSGQVGALTNFSDFTPYIQFQPAGAYQYMNLFLRKTETFGFNSYNTYVALALGDNDGTVTPGVLPGAIVAGDYDFVNLSFEVYGGNQSYRSLTHSVSTGLSQVIPSGVPEPATWAMMLAGFGAIGASLRRRRMARVCWA